MRKRKRLASEVLKAGPQVAGHTIWHSEHQHCLIIDQRIVDLTPTEYALVMVLLSAYDRWQRSNHAMLFRISPEHLQHAAGVYGRRLLTKHINGAAEKLAPLLIDIPWVNSKQNPGYGLTFDSVEEVGERAS